MPNGVKQPWEQDYPQRGEPQPWEQDYGGTTPTQAAPTFAEQHPILATAGEVASGLGGEIMRQGYNLAKPLIGKIPGIEPYIEQRPGTGEAIGRLAGDIVPWMAAPEIKGPMALRALGAGATGAGIGVAQGTSPLAGGLAGLTGFGLGEAAQAIAPKLAESALGITNRMRAFGKTPGQAILKETAGYSPEAVKESARESLNALTDQLVDVYRRTPNQEASLTPARQVLEVAEQKAKQQQDQPMLEFVGNLKERLTTDFTTGEPFGDKVTPERLLAIKRGTRAGWNPNIDPREAEGLSRKLYRALDKELDRVAPEGKELNQRISSLIPVERRADIEMRGPGLVGNVAQRVAAKTGALVPAAMGGTLGYQHGGVPGAIAGVGLGAVLPELISSPQARLGMARLGPSIMRRLPGTAFALRGLLPEEEEKK